MALLGWVRQKQGGRERRKSPQLVPALKTHRSSVATLCVFVLEDWKEEGEKREMDGGWSFEFSVFVASCCHAGCGCGVGGDDEEERSGRWGMNNKLCTFAYTNLSVEFTQAKRKEDSSFWLLQTFFFLSLHLGQREEGRVRRWCTLFFSVAP